MIVWDDIEKLTKNYHSGFKKLDGLNEKINIIKIKLVIIKISFILVLQMKIMHQMIKLQLNHLILNMIQILKN